MAAAKRGAATFRKMVMPALESAFGRTTQIVAAQLREDLRNLADQIFPVRAMKLAQVDAVPALDEPLPWRRRADTWDGLERGVEGRIEEERHGDARAPGNVDHAMKRRGIATRGQPLE